MSRSLRDREPSRPIRVLRDETLGTQIHWQAPRLSDYRTAADPAAIFTQYLNRLVFNADDAAILTKAQVPLVVDDLLWILRWRGYTVQEYDQCPDNCGCRLDGEDAARRDCACGGPCCDGEIRYRDPAATMDEPLPGI